MLDDILGYRKVTIGHCAAWVHPLTGRVLPVVHGGADGDDPPTPTPKWTDDDVDRFKGQARAEARRAAANELAEQLGCTVEEAKTKIDALTALEAANQTEAQRAAAEAAAATAARDQAVADAAAARAELTNTQALTTGDNPVNPKHLAHALALLNLPADADEATRTARIEALRTEVPAFFTSTATPPPPGGFTPPTPPTPPGPPAGGKSALEAGREIAQKRYPQPTAA